MYFQQKDYSCGHSSARNILSIAGIEVTEEEIRKIPEGDERDGSDEIDLSVIFDHFGCSYKYLNAYSTEYAWSKLRKLIKDGYAVVICVDKWRHWSVAIGLIGNKINIFDPAYGDGGRKTNEGTLTYSKEDLLKRWKKRIKGQEMFFGIAVKVA